MANDIKRRLEKLEQAKNAMQAVERKRVESLDEAMRILWNGPLSKEDDETLDRIGQAIWDRKNAGLEVTLLPEEQAELLEIASCIKFPDGGPGEPVGCRAMTGEEILDYVRIQDKLKGMICPSHYFI